jgi:hypothetical protein
VGREYVKAVSDTKETETPATEAKEPDNSSMSALPPRPRPAPVAGQGRARAGSSDDEDDALDRPANVSSSEMAAVKQLADQQRSFFGAKPLPAGGAPAGDVTFRRRRLTFATQGNITPHTPLHQIQQRVFRSLEIGDVPKVPLPFPETVVATYSCHGIEPSYMDSQPFVAKINQDRGIVVYPFAGKESQAIFAVFDGHGEVGDKVSEFCMYEVPKLLEAHPLVDTDIVTAFKETFVAVDERLGKQPNIEVRYHYIA